MEYNTSSEQLSKQHSLLGKGFILLCLILVAFPVWQIAQWLAAELTIPENTPVIEHANGWLWFLGFITEGVVLLLCCYAVLSAGVALILKWPRTQYVNIFWKNRFPSHWKKQ